MFPEVSLAFFCKPCVECLWRNSDMVPLDEQAEFFVILKKILFF